MGRGARSLSDTMPTTPVEKAQRDDGAPAPLGASASPPPQRVAIVIPVSTLAVLLGFGLLVFLAIVSFGTLLSIFLAAVLAFGLDPPTAALVRRGWGRGRASLVLFAALFVSVVALVILAAGPVWDQIVEFIAKLPQ